MFHVSDEFICIKGVFPFLNRLEMAKNMTKGKSFWQLRLKHLQPSRIENDWWYAIGFVESAGVKTFAI